MANVELALLVDRFMRRIHISLQGKASVFDTENVGPAGGMLLLTLSDMGHPEMHELTERFARDKSQMTRVVRALETKGLVKRQISDRDQRANTISLTSEGHQFVNKLKHVIAETVDDIVEPLNKTEKDQFERLLKRIIG